MIGGVDTFSETGGLAALRGPMAFGYQYVNVGDGDTGPVLIAGTEGTSLTGRVVTAPPGGRPTRPVQITLIPADVERSPFYELLDIPLHGYGDVYTDAELDRYAELEDLDPGWIDTLDRLAPRAALLDEESRLVPALEGLGWTTTLEAKGLSWLRPPPSG